jgi:O-antigen/teichoic acid export membrane protein
MTYWKYISNINNIKLIELKGLFKKRKSKQVGSLYSSMILGTIVGVGVSVVNTRFLGPQQYGDLKFLQTLFTFVVTFLTLGLFVSGSRLLAIDKNETIKRGLTGNLLILAAAISVLLVVIFFVFSFYEERLFNNELGATIRIFSPLLFVFPFKICLENIMQGDNRIYELSLFRVFPQVFYLIGAISFNFFVPLSLFSALLIQMGMLALIIVVFIIKFKPKLGDIKKNISLIWQENKIYGFPVYVGSLANVATGHLGGLSIGYFIDNVNVGYYALALVTATPLAMIPGAVGTTLFKDFANRSTMPRKATAITFVLSIGTLVILLIVIEKVILLLYSEKYIAAVPLAYLVSIGAVFHGLGDYYNRFLGAQGRGKDLRNSAFVQGLWNVLGFTVLVYFLGVKGAAITKCFSGIIYFAAIFIYYKKFIRKHQV